MDQQLKQRLVGAAVLISLAVIFIPMLLDQNDPSSLPHFGSAVPERPDFRFDPIEIPLQLPPETEPSSAEVLERPIAEARASEVNAKPAPSTDTKPQPQASDESSEKGTPLAWAVQVGSFDRESNAAQLRDQLRAKGFAAYLEKVKVKGGMHYRVRVGPELRRELAEGLRNRLQQKLGQDGFIVRHPS